MLSKSQARLFFVGGTILFSLVFLFLTIDTVRSVPKQTHQGKLTESVVRGKKIWESKNCMGCHTILGEGAYYAPELTKAYERRGEPWLKIFLKDPQAMYPGKRKMVQYNFSDQQISDVISFLKWIGEMDLNGFPAKPSLASKVQTAGIAIPQGESSKSVAASSRPAVFNTICIACHSIGGSGGIVGPALDGVGNRYDSAYLKKWLLNPQAVKPGTAMPKLPLQESQINDLVDFLTGLK